MHTIDVLALCTAAAFIVVMAAVLARQRYMLRAGGAVPVAMRVHGSRWGYGIARYVGSELQWFRAMGIGTRPSKVLRREDLSVLKSRAPSAAEVSSLPASAVVVECRHGAQTCTLAFSESAFTGFVSWLEGSPPG